MFRSIRVKPSKSAAVFGMVVGIIFVIIGIAVAIPTFGLFGIFWTQIALAITGFIAYNAFSQKGGACFQVDVESTEDDFEAKLRKIERLRQDRLITEEEYRRKREEVLNQKW